MGSDKRSHGSVNINFNTSRPLMGSMEKFTDVLSVLIVLHLRIKLGGSFC